MGRHEGVRPAAGGVRARGKYSEVVPKRNSEEEVIKDYIMAGDLIISLDDAAEQAKLYLPHLENKIFEYASEMVPSNSCTASSTTWANQPPMDAGKMLREMKELFEKYKAKPVIKLGFGPIPYPRLQAKKHRKRRINKKWLKKYGTKPDTSVDGEVFVIKNEYVTAYPKTYERLRGLLGEPMWPEPNWMSANYPRPLL